AVKFSEPDHPVTIGADRRGAAAVVWVRDEGQGIPPDEVGQLFRRFGRTSVRSTRGEQQTGLGLYICRQIVGLHSGDIEVQTAPGAGSTFTVVLPAQAL